MTARLVEQQLSCVERGYDARTADLAREIERLEGQASHLVRFLATGGDSPAVRAELRAIETTLAGLRAEWATIDKASALPPPWVHAAWVMTKLERLDALLRRDPQRAKVEILKHLDGDLVIVPRPSSPGERRAEISGRANADRLLRDQEAVRLQVVAGARNHLPANRSVAFRFEIRAYKPRLRSVSRFLSPIQSLVGYPYLMRQAKSHNPRLWRDIPWAFGTWAGFLAQDGRHASALSRGFGQRYAHRLLVTGQPRRVPCLRAIPDGR